MRILFILENFYPYIGGVETLFKNLTTQLVKEKIEVTVLTNRFSKELKKEETLDGVKIVRLPFRNRYLFTFLAGFSAVKYARRHDLIHTTSYNAGIPAFLAKLLTGKYTVITFHEVWNKLWFKLPFMNKISLTFHYLFEWFLLKLPFNKFIAVSDYTGKSLENAGISASKIQRIYNGIDYKEFSKFKRQNPNAFNFTYFGRLGISKGLDILLDAIEVLDKKNLDFKFNLIIPSLPVSFHQTILNLISSKKLSSRIEIYSDLKFEKLFDHVSKSSAVVIPSYSEGFCYTAVETISMGVPVISSDMGALKEVVGGKHIKMEDYSSKALANAMERALRGEWDETPVKEFHLDVSINQYIDFYRTILSDKES